MDPDRNLAKASLAGSTQSASNLLEGYELPRKSTRSSYAFGMHRKTRQSMGAYTSLFARKLLPPLGFYRETEKYARMKVKFADDPYKLDALEEMWQDYQKYQVRKRFRWPPTSICKMFFWTTGYYPDYQKEHRPTKLRKPGELGKWEDSSDEEFIAPAGAFMVANQDDINVEEFERYREAKRTNQPDSTRTTRFNLEDNQEVAIPIEKNTDPGYLVDRRPTVVRLFDDGPGDKSKDKGNDKGKDKGNDKGKDKGKDKGNDKGKDKGNDKGNDKDNDKGNDKGNDVVDRRPTVSRLFDDETGDEGNKDKDKQEKKIRSAPREVEEVETIVEYQLIRDPNKKKRKSSSVKSKAKRDSMKEDIQTTVDGISFDELTAGVNKKIITRKKSTTDPVTGKTEVQVTSETIGGKKE